MRRMRMALFVLCLLLTITWGWKAPLLAAAAEKPVQLKIATLDMGSSWYIYGATFAELITKELPSGSRVDVLPYSGSIGNPKLVTKGDADMGLVMGIVGKWAYDGKHVFDTKYQNLRALVGGIDQYYYALIAREDLNIESLKEIREKKLAVKIVTQPKGTLNAVMSYMVLEAYGITREDLKKIGGTITHTSTDVIASDIKDGRANLWFQPATAGHPSITSVAVTTKIRFLPYEPAVVQKLSDEYGFSPAVLPAKAFQGQNKDVPMIGYRTCLFGSIKMPDSVAYAVAKALCEGEQKMKAAHKGMKAFNPAKAWDPKITGLPLHPGAEKYFKEKGYMK
ncbi:MAG: TAXI family TRAP transporter solute-binding subunit [Pseudomonadota bacterium]